MAIRPCGHKIEGKKNCCAAVCSLNFQPTSRSGRPNTASSMISFFADLTFGTSILCVCVCIYIYIYAYLVALLSPAGCYHKRMNHEMSGKYMRKNTLEV